MGVLYIPVVDEPIRMRSVCWGHLQIMEWRLVNIWIQEMKVCHFDEIYVTGGTGLLWYQPEQTIDLPVTWDTMALCDVTVMQFKLYDPRFKSIYSIMYRHQSYKSTEQCENKSNISWVHVLLRPYDRYRKGLQRMFISAGRIMVSKYDNIEKINTKSK